MTSGPVRDLQPADGRSERSLARARSMAKLLDSSLTIPGTGRKIGLDPLLGLVPFVGDFIGALLSGYIVLAAARAGVPTFTLIRMLANVGADTLAGSIPILGDVFDAAWKSNAKNVALFEKHVAGNTPARSAKDAYGLSGSVLVVSALLLLALLTFAAYLVYLAVRHALTGR